VTTLPDEMEKIIQKHESLRFVSAKNAFTNKSVKISIVFSLRETSPKFKIKVQSKKSCL